MNPANPLSPGTVRQSPRRRRGFTLIELLTVIAVIGILFSITVTVGRGVRERGQIARAKAELAVLAAALEQYKLQYGDYPWVEVNGAAGYDPAYKNQKALFKALTGQLGPKHATLTSRQLVELSKLSTKNGATNLVENWFVDPWGHSYSYYYKTLPSGGGWVNPGFVLYSHGPDESCVYPNPDAAGNVDATNPQNADNIVAGRN